MYPSSSKRYKMKDISEISKSKDAIIASKANKEFIYYLVLFSIAFAAAVALIVIAFVNKNTGLKIYSLILAPVFLILTALSIRLLYASVNSVFVKGDLVYIKRPLYTKKILISSIDDVKVASNEKDGTAWVKVIYGDKEAKLKLGEINKEELLRFKKIKSIYTAG